MHADKISITDEDIEYAEQILFGKNNAFNDSRIKYLKTMSTLDLQAVPGSGKTTLLLAKLLILNKKMEKQKLKGILVLSHTNTAINEIEKSIYSNCSKIFEYPNFVGTIQSFINQFLAIPYYENKTGHKVIQVNDDYYNLSVENFFNYTRDYSLKKWLLQQGNPLEFLQGLRFDQDFNLIQGPFGNVDSFRLKDKSKHVYKSLKKMKIDILNRGILCYSDAYILAERYISEFPQIVNILNSRFKMVFVDEMQDMDIKQYSLIEQLFYNDSTILQRLGDTNQAIYNGMNNNRVEWKLREQSIFISDSNRLSLQCAKMASRFSFNECMIAGLNNYRDSIKPILYVYENTEIECQIIKRFSKDLSEIFKEELDAEKELSIKAIAWRKETDSTEKTSLKAYCPKYKSTVKTNNQIELCNSEYADFNITYNTLIDVLFNILSKKQIEVSSTQNLRKSELNNYIENSDKRKMIKSSMYNLCVFTFNNDADSFKKELHKLVSTISKDFNLELLENDINRELKSIIEDNRNEKPCEECCVGNSRIVVTSAHSVKGETHDATLFMESYFKKKYESDILHRVLKGENVSVLITEIDENILALREEINRLNGCRGSKTKISNLEKLINERKRIEEYTKLLYVSFSRPRYVIAYAISRSRYDEYDLQNISGEWNIIFIKGEQN